MKCWFGAVVWKSVKRLTVVVCFPSIIPLTFCSVSWKWEREREFYHTRIPELTIGDEDHQTQHKEWYDCDISGWKDSMWNLNHMLSVHRLLLI